MQIIKIEAFENGGHDNQSWDGIIPPEGYAIIPDGMQLDNFPFGEVEVKEANGILVVVKWIPGVMPETETSGPTTQEDIDSMLIDHEYRLTLLELGVTE